jgi:DNA-binding CsgD family transcriptional regulator
MPGKATADLDEVSPARGMGTVMKHAKDGGSQLPHLSFRQQQILHCIIKGCHNKTIAYLLGIQLVTVKMHVGLLFKKLHVTNRTEAAVLGLVSFGGDLATECDPSRISTKRPGGLPDVADASLLRHATGQPKLAAIIPLTIPLIKHAASRSALPSSDGGVHDRTSKRSFPRRA